MERDRWQRIEGIYHAAMQCGAAERGSLLEAACAEDEELRAEVESLIQYGQRPSNFLESPPWNSWPRCSPKIFSRLKTRRPIR